MKNHMLTHTGTQQSQSLMIQLQKNKIIYSLKLYSSFLKSEIGDKPFVCTKCDKQFSLQCNLKSHMKSHHKE